MGRMKMAKKKWKPIRHNTKMEKAGIDEHKFEMWSSTKKAVYRVDYDLRNSIYEFITKDTDPNLDFPKIPQVILGSR